MGLVLAYAGIAQAANTLKVRNVELAPGGSVTLNVELDNETTNLMGWQCDIVLPEGLSLELKSNGKPAATLGGRFSTTGHTISSSRLANGAYRFIATSMDGEAIPETTGTLFSVTLKADVSVTAGSTLTGTVTNIEFNTQDNKKKTLGDISFSVTIPGGGTIIQPNDQLTVNDLDLAPSGSVTLNDYTSEGSTPIGTPSITCAATSASPIGQYPIRISRGSVSNGEATFVDGMLTITKAPLTITAKSYSIKQGEPLPATYEINFSGFKNGETKSVLSQQPSVTCAATAASEPGRYDIIVSGAAAKNYEISYVKGTLRIRDLSSIKGDINDDGEVDVTDVVELIDMVLGGIYDAVGDINGDGEVDVTDVVELIDMVLAGE